MCAKLCMCTVLASFPQCVWKARFFSETNHSLCLGCAFGDQCVCRGKLFRETPFSRTVKQYGQLSMHVVDSMLQL